MSAPAAYSPSRRSPLLRIALCVIVIPLAQYGLGYISAIVPSPWPWLAGTPLAYLLIAGIGAFFATQGLSPAQARGRGSVIGVSVGVGGALVATLIVIAYAIWLVVAPSLVANLSVQRHPSPVVVITGIATWSPTIPPIVLIIFFMPFFLVTNVLGIGFATLGGLLGGQARGYFTQQGSPEWRRPAMPDQTGSRDVNLALLVVIVTLLVVVLLVAGAVLMFGAFGAIHTTLVN